MHKNNEIRNPHEKLESAKKIGVKFNDKGKMEVTRRAEIVLQFDVPVAGATDNWLNAVIGIIRREVAVDLGKSAQVTGKWL